ncbi:hypothetical protein OBBRIDRAFT_773637 [Obba rivulosa]|uniref:Uncharacterized protein n=1 Tax=Obba rivulosa TaxID=1052685 RepID=A0A8E2AWH6_9APHY|nr:hypothetical protein OBBRIDRAFT_773637 [Obba rivulosa]
MNSSTVLAAPQYLWHLYIEYLWNYKPGSWVDSTAYTFRVLAFLTIAPFVGLTLLDVASYVVARTLGVIETTKASTSETGTVNGGSGCLTPAIVVHGLSPPARDEPGTKHTCLTVPPPAYFRGPLEEEGNLELSGVGTLSPAPSQPSSPTMARRELSQQQHDYPFPPTPPGEGEKGPVDGPLASLLRERHASADSSSSESSYAMLDQESGSEHAEVVLRRRTGPDVKAEEGTSNA